MSLAPLSAIFSYDGTSLAEHVLGSAVHENTRGVRPVEISVQCSLDEEFLVGLTSPALDFPGSLAGQTYVRLRIDSSFSPIVSN